MSNARDSHGTKIRRNGTILAEVRDITPPDITRKTFETTIQTEDNDAFIAGGVLRRGILSFMVNMVLDDETQDSDSGLLDAIINKSLDLYEVEFEGGGEWMFSAYCVGFKPKAPTEGPLEATIEVRPTGAMVISDTGA